MAKSKVVKKTLNPDFNENLGEFKVPSRVGAEAIFEAYDWDQVGTPDKLGNAQVDLSVLEPFEPFEKTYPLTGKGSTENSEVTLRFVFKPTLSPTANAGYEHQPYFHSRSGRCWKSGCRWRSGRWYWSRQGRLWRW